MATFLGRLLSKVRHSERSHSIPETVADPTLIWEEARRNAEQASHLVRLPFRTGGRLSGNLQSRDNGSSLEFRDHRAYIPGDDPRQIDWRAYARTEALILKVYHQETSPAGDIVIDMSRSMGLSTDKFRRTVELAQLCIHSVLRSGASPKCYIWTGTKIALTNAQQFLVKQPDLDLPVTAAAVPVPLSDIPWAAGSLRILISDLLFIPPGDSYLRVMSVRRGRPLLLVPFARDEADPDWDGQAEFVDCETGFRRFQRVTPALVKKYKEAYRRHFQLWKNLATRAAASMALVPAELDLVDALREEAFSTAVFEPC